TTVITPSNITSLISTSINSLGRTDYTNAQNWFPNLNLEKQNKNQNVESYILSVPSLGVYDATVSTVDYDLAKHLVNYPGTQIPPRNGNSVIFGHSTLPQLFNPKDYKTIFATLYKIKVGNEIFVKSSGVLYKYRVYSIIVVDPLDTSIFAQSYDNSYLTLVTCTPPGTTWKRLIVKTRLEKL
ncbi:MAG: sortase, partial [bacterium]|nr:sortase [bacterium]